MWNKIILYLKKFDWIMLAAVMLLICFGLVELYSIALSKEALDLINFNKQVFAVGIGLIMMFFLAFFDYHNLRSFSNYIYLAGLVMLASVLIFGESIRGTRGWFNLGGISIQPVELAKVILIIFLAKYFSSVSIKVNPLKHLLVSGAATGIFSFLVLRQPDFGSALILFFLWAGLLVLAGFSRKYIAAILLVLAMIFASGWLFFFQDYQKQRIMTFLNPAAESMAMDEGYNITQAIIAVGSGGLTGRGIGFGSQSQLKFLPEAQNDFIFAVIAEELGFLGIFLVLGFFGVFFYRILSNVRKINNNFGIYFLLGAMVLIFIEMFINIGMNIGLLPVVGISLPFLSYGGSAIVSSLIIVGIAESIIIRSKLKY